MNIFLASALSVVTDENGLQDFYASPLIKEDWKLFDASMYHEGFNTLDFIIKYYASNSKLPTFEMTCQQFNIELDLKIIGSFKFYEEKIIQRKKLQLYGELLQQSHGLYTGANEGNFQENFDALEKCIEDILTLKLELSQGQKSVALSTLAPKLKEKYEKLEGGEKGKLLPWKTINDDINGVWPGEILGIAARNGRGKTWLLLQAADYYRSMGERVLVVATEMIDESLAARWASLYAKIPHNRVRKGKLGADLKAVYFQALDDIEKGLNSFKGVRILSSDFEATTNNIEASIIEFEPTVILIDSVYLTVYSPSPRLDKIERAPFVTACMKRWAKKYKAPVVFTTQFNRRASDKDIETLCTENLAYSDAYGQDSDFLYAMRRTDDMKNEGVVQVIPIKTREGAGGKYFNVSTNWTTMEFFECDDSRNLIPPDGYNQVAMPINNNTNSFNNNYSSEVQANFISDDVEF